MLSVLDAPSTNPWLSGESVLIDYHTIQCAALDAKESGLMVMIHPDIMLEILSEVGDLRRIRDYQRDQLIEANKKLNKIKRVLG